ncbi:outer membrane protein assembly factor BamD [Candidatus Pantoea carbekii]|uniref:Outer membrane protein assembly factor BamD n=1 Tax=Candidatus Pantoea carbekii TaxID=1235990 RepID=U3U5Q1_9GAMM|nr:outer membrane protein assembly factor BamD [Candidatus Pantoea carbekii]AKC32439.1 hypothetical protein BMSBPS_0658 [Candidatus Pantoea carbekii]BAO00165.1 hypothetical protein HHS_01950 [Candidatus Pantoea carbekii]
MIYKKHLILIIILNLGIVDCADLSFPLPKMLPSEIYETAQKKLQANNFQDAITQLEILNNRYPFGPYSQQVQLDLIYAYYKNNNFSLAQTVIKNFIHLNSTHANIDYVIYMKGLINMTLDQKIFWSILKIVDSSDRDSKYALDAWHDFLELLRKYPKSYYAADAYKRLIYLKERIAKYELQVVEFYINHRAYIAAVKRVESMLKNYPDTLSTYKALPLMEHAYYHLKMPEEAKKVTKIIAFNNRFRIN